MEYLWTKHVQLPSFPALARDCSTDVLIIGGGMAGILCALLLQQAGVNCLLAEGQTIGGGITKGTTAVLTAQHDTLYTDLTRTFGAARAALYLEANLDALRRFQTLARTIPCGFEELPSLVYSCSDREKMQREASVVRYLGFPAEFTEHVPLPLEIAGAVRFPGMAQFHPLQFLAGAAKELPILEHTFVRRLAGTTAYTDHGTITAKKVIVATHFPFVNRRGLYFMKLYQKRSFVLALRNAPNLHCTMMDATENGLYFRNYGDLLLIGGGDHRTWKTNGGFACVREYAQQLFPGAVEALAWANQDCMSLDGVPYIGPYSPAMPHVYVATGFNEWGMTSSMAAAALLTDLVTGRENKFSPVFTPSRSVLRAQLFSNLGATLIDFATPTTKRCPHLGCALRWNKAEHSWDCPCHGSRFTTDGALIDNPAMRDSRSVRPPH